MLLLLLSLSVVLSAAVFEPFRLQRVGVWGTVGGLLGFYGYREQQALKQALLERQQELEQSELLMVPAAAAAGGCGQGSTQAAPMDCTVTCFEGTRPAHLAYVLSTGSWLACCCALCGCVSCAFITTPEHMHVAPEQVRPTLEPKFFQELLKMEQKQRQEELRAQMHKAGVRIPPGTVLSSKDGGGPGQQQDGSGSDAQWPGADGSGSDDQWQKLLNSAPWLQEGGDEGKQ